MFLLESFVGMLAAFGLVCLLWLVRSMLFRSQKRLCVTTVVPVRGTGEELEQTVKSLLRLRKAGLWQGTILIRDDGLTAEGRGLLERLCQQNGVRSICSSVHPYSA